MGLHFLNSLNEIEKLSFMRVTKILAFGRCHQMFKIFLILLIYTRSYKFTFPKNWLKVRVENKNMTYSRVKMAAVELIHSHYS